MDPYRVSATLSQEDHQVVIAALDTINQKLPFLIDLTIAERRSMPKRGDKTEAFVRRGFETAIQHETLFPAAFMEELRKDTELLDSLAPIRTAIDTLQKRLDDTAMQVGAEAYAAARTVYQVTKQPFANAALRNAGDDLAKRYVRKKAAATPPQPEPQTPAVEPQASTPPAPPEPSTPPSTTAHT